MSLAAFKQKSLTLYGKSHSVGHDGFSLNGKRRVRGISYGLNLGQSPLKTPFKGNYPCGYGGGAACRIKQGQWGRLCSSGFPIHVLATTTTTAQTLVKRSVMNTKGMIQDKYMGILHGTYPNVVSSPPESLDSGTYTTKVEAEPMSCEHGYTNTGEGQNNPNLYAKDYQMHAHGYKNDYLLKYNNKCLNGPPHYPVKNYQLCLSPSYNASPVNKNIII